MIENKNNCEDEVSILIFVLLFTTRPNVDDSVAALTEFRTQAIIVEYMIRNVDVFFDKNLASAAIAYYPEIQDVPIEGKYMRDHCSINLLFDCHSCIVMVSFSFSPYCGLSFLYFTQSNSKFITSILYSTQNYFRFYHILCCRLIVERRI